MPRSLLLSLVAAITLAACSKQEADTGAAPAPDTAAPEANAPVDTTAVDRMPADTTAVPADTALVEETVPADTAPAAETDGQHHGRADRHGRAGRQLCRLLSSVDKHTVAR